MSTQKEQFKPIVFQLQKLEENIFDKPIKPKYTKIQPYPLFDFGFHYLVYDTKNKMEITNDAQIKSSVYYVVNPFEHKITNHDDDIQTRATKFFDLKNKPNILSRAFYKLWEIFFMFDIIPTDNNFSSAHLAEGPGSFIQATLHFRDKYAPKFSKNDKYHAITLHSEAQHVPPLDKDFINYYTKEKPQRFMQHKTWASQVAGGSKDKDDGDLTKMKTIKLFGGQIGKDYVDLVTADGGFDWMDENFQEQEAMKLILAQVITAIRIQKKGGSFVCKIFESFTLPMCKLTYILLTFYDNVFITKPLTSRPSNSERYLVCKNFKYDHNKKDNTFELYSNQLEEVLEKWPKDTYLSDLFPEFTMPKDFTSIVKSANIAVTNKQLTEINKIVSYIKEANYFGDKYHKYISQQKEANKFWSTIFLVDDYSTSRNTIHDIVVEVIDSSKNKVGKLYKEGSTGDYSMYAM